MIFKFYIKILVLSLTIYGVLPSHQNASDEQVLPLSEGQNYLYLDNYYGSVTVNIHQENTIVIYTEVLPVDGDSKKHTTLDNEVSVITTQYPDGWHVYTETMCTKVFPDQRKVKYCCCDDEEVLQKVNYKILVPEHVNVRIAAISHGNIVINDLHGSVDVTNVNGDIRLTNLSGKITSETVNGDIESEFTGQIADSSSFETLNGNVYLTCPENLSASIEFDAFLGDFYTDFTNAIEGPELAENSVNTENDINHFEYKVVRAINVGSASRHLKTKTFNGNVYLIKSNL